MFVTDVFFGVDPENQYPYDDGYYGSGQTYNRDYDFQMSGSSSRMQGQHYDYSGMLFVCFPMDMF